MLSHLYAHIIEYAHLKATDLPGGPPLGMFDQLNTIYFVPDQIPN